MELTAEQKQVHDKIIDWFNSKASLLTFGGFAGVGKTTLVAEVAKTIKGMGKRIAFCTFAGKASTVLRAKLGDVLTDDDYCGTIHSLIYRLVGKNVEKRTLYFETTDNHLPYDLIILDEASMVGEYVFQDLARNEIPILAVGDHGQLPPVKGSFNLMEEPMVKLEKIMRQAENNPIIKMSHMARTDGIVPYGEYGFGCSKTRDLRVLHDHPYSSKEAIMLCASNKTRVKMNEFAREKLNIQGVVKVGEPVICLYNNRKKRIFNGQIGSVDSVGESNPGYLHMKINLGDNSFSGDVFKGQFNKIYIDVDEKDDQIDYFDFAYCITTHKSQGSEFDEVLVIEERLPVWNDDTWRRWLYTAISRGKNKVTIFKR